VIFHPLICPRFLRRGFFSHKRIGRTVCWITIESSSDGNQCSDNYWISGSGAAALAHLDGSGTEDAAAAMIQRVTELSVVYPEGRLELQLVGGYSDPRNYSEELFYNILCAWKMINDKLTSC
jgi:hypothetical protein